MLTDQQARILLDEIDRAARRAAAARSSKDPVAWTEARTLTEYLERILDRLLAESVEDVRRKVEASIPMADPQHYGAPIAEMWRRIYRAALSKLDEVQAAA